MSPWAWLGFAVVALVVLALVAFVLSAIWSGARDGAKAAQADNTCPRCGHPIGEPWPSPTERNP